MIIQLKNILSTVVDWVFPPRRGERVVTEFTQKDIFSFPKAYDNLPHNTHALFSYKDSRVASLVWEIKYHKNINALNLLTPLLADLIQDEYTDKALFTRWDKCFLVPVPSTHIHVQERGYNHTQFICEKLISLLPQDITYKPNLLIKTVNTPEQHKLKDRNLRLTNLKNTQAVTEILPKHTAVILIDDVTTTGATIQESRRALMDAGVKDIFAFTIAH